MFTYLDLKSSVVGFRKNMKGMTASLEAYERESLGKLSQKFVKKTRDRKFYIFRAVSIAEFNTFEN